MQVEVNASFKVNAAGGEVVVRWLISPRGSGNRSRAVRLAALVRKDRYLKPHLRRVVARTSSVTAYVRVGPNTFGDVLQGVMQHADGARDVPGQLDLFAASKAKV